MSHSHINQTPESSFLVALLFNELDGSIQIDEDAEEERINDGSEANP